MSNADRIRVSIAEESSFGVAPSPLDWLVLETTGQSLRPRIGYQQSRTIRNDRNVQDLIRLQKAASGGLPMELRHSVSGEGLDLMMAAVMCQASYTAAGTYSGCSTSAGSKTITQASGDFTTSIEIGDVIKTSGATPAGDNGFFKVLTVDALTMTVEADSNFTGSASNVTVTRGARLKNGTAERTFMIEVARLDLQTAQVFTGCVIDAMEFNVSDGAITTCNFTIQAAGSTRYPTNNGTTDEFGSANSYTDPNVRPVLDCIGVPEVRRGGVSYAAKTIAMTAANNVSPRTQIGTFGAQSMRWGQFSASGRITSYLEDLTDISSYEDNTATDLWTILTDPNDRGWSLSLPHIKFSDAGADTTGPNQDDQLDIAATAILDPTELCTARLQRWD